MRLKVRPEDFVVCEQLEFDEVPDGPFYVHLLRKEKLDTLSALGRVARLAGVSRAEIAFAGLKDRQGRTEQWITIRGRRVDYRDHELQVVFHGRTDRPITSRSSSGNRFDIVVRDLDQRDVERLQTTATAVLATGLPNYFDDQRFGCLTHGQGFAMHDVLRGDYESALRRLIARPSPRAITGDVKLKRILAEHWGEWERCASIARGPTFGRALRHLVADGRDFAGAIELLPARARLIAAFAYQSFLWNRAVDRMLYHALPPQQRVLLPTRIGRLSAWDGVPAATQLRLEAAVTPLFVPGRPAGDAAFRDATAEVLRGEGLGAAIVAAPRGMELREEPRALVVRPLRLQVGQPESDAHERGKMSVRLTFALPRGSYATLVIKRLLAQRASARHAADPAGADAARAALARRRPR